MNIVGKKFIMKITFNFSLGIHKYEVNLLSHPYGWFYLYGIDASSRRTKWTTIYFSGLQCNVHRSNCSLRELYETNWLHGRV